MTFNKIHLSTARKMLMAPEPVDLKVWDKNGELIEFKSVVGLKSAHYAGTRNVKSLASGEIRKIRDCLIYEINGQKVFL